MQTARRIAAAVGVLLVAGCASAPTQSGPSVSGTCPVTPVRVVVSVNQWGDITSALGAACAQVDTIIADSKIDPHDYEPTPGDISAFGSASVVVLNGVGYDAWAQKAVAALSTAPAVVDAGVVNSVALGSNPHLWYRPDAVTATADAITAALARAAPGAASFFQQQHASWLVAMKPYFDEVARVKAGVHAQSYGATESVFDYMAGAVGLVDKTPPGYRQAIANGSDPAPGDLNAFQTALTGKQMTVLIVNTQTAAAVTDQLRAAATGAGVPIVEVTETVPAGAVSFQDWQIHQLTALATALGIS